MLSFRSATTADSAEIHRLWDAAGVSQGFENDTAEITERLRNDDGFFVVGEAEGRLVAAAMGCYDDHRGWLKRVAIDPSMQGRGFGRSIVEEVEQRFLAAGIAKLRLAVWSENTSALAFWSELDYLELDEIRYFTKDLTDNPEDNT
ncbi:MAG: GNAT family N-acetyltransferase [Acidimicrobiales bacterium]